MCRYNVMLVDDEPLLLESLEIILTFGGMNVMGMARDGSEAMEVISKNPCDIALVDLNMEGMGGIELIKRLKSEYTNVKILVLTTFYDDKNITDAILSGADGYLLKDSGRDAILGAVRQIMGGQTVIDSKVMQRMAVLMGRDRNDESYLLECMTEREKEICTLLSQGHTNRQIAETLYISEGTVKNYVSSIYDKTGIHDRSKLIVALKG